MSKKKSTLAKSIAQGGKQILILGSGIDYDQTIRAIERITEKDQLKLIASNDYNSEKLVIDKRITESELIELCQKEYPNLQKLTLKEIENITEILIKAGNNLTKSLSLLNEALSEVYTITVKSQVLTEEIQTLEISLNSLKKERKIKPYQDRYAKRFHNKSKW